MFDSTIGFSLTLAVAVTAIGLVGLLLERINQRSVVWRHCVLKSTIFSILVAVPLILFVSPRLPAVFELKWPLSNALPMAGVEMGSHPTSIEGAQSSQNRVHELAADRLSSSEQAAPPMWWSKVIPVCILCLWFSGTAYGIVRLGSSLFYMSGVLAKSKRPARSTANKLRRALHGNAAVIQRHLRVTEHVATPCLAGLVSPTILIPDSFVKQLDEEELQQVLVHEFAHLKRYDQITILFNQLVRTLFWWNPVVRILHGQLSQSCEEMCDNHVLAEFDSISYSTTLYKIAHSISSGQPQSLEAAPCLLTNSWLLEHRVKGILSDARDRRFHTSRMISAPVVLLFICVSMSAVVIGKPVFACFAGEPPSALNDGPSKLAPEETSSQPINSPLSESLELTAYAEADGTLAIKHNGQKIIQMEGDGVARAQLKPDEKGWSILIDDELTILLIVDGFDQPSLKASPFRLGAPFGYSQTDQGDTCVRLSRVDAQKENAAFRPTGFITCVARSGSSYTLRF